MPPRQFSRFSLSGAINSGPNSADQILTERVPFRFVADPNTVQHSVVAGDSLFTIAARYYGTLDRPAGLWWVIADFQPDPIHDPTLALEPGTTIFVPSLQLVQSEVFNEARRVD